MSFPILEYDPTRQAVIEPSKLIAPINIPKIAVICFFQEVIAKVTEEHNAKIIHHFNSEMGKTPLYELETNNGNVAVFHPGVGAPLAAGYLEEAIALGCEKFIACGGAGVLDRDIAVGHLIIPDQALRDEGTSYHYLPPARMVGADPRALEVIQNVLDSRNVPYLVGPTWTTDAFYRETPAKVQRRREEGCLVVEMEASAFFAVAQFRNVVFGQILYGGDDVSSPEWDHRGWQTRNSVRENIFWLAVEASQSL